MLNFHLWPFNFTICMKYHWHSEKRKFGKKIHIFHNVHYTRAISVEMCGQAAYSCIFGVTIIDSTCSVNEYCSCRPICLQFLL